MNLKRLNSAVRAYEEGARVANRAVTDRASLAAELDSPGDLIGVIDALPDPETFVALARRMPDTSPLAEVLKAFLPDAAAFGDFVATTLKGNLDLLAALAADGCDRAPAKLKDLADTFSGSTQLQEMLGDGGLGDHPGAMAGMVGAMDVAEFKTVCDRFDTGTKRKELAAVLGPGGLAMAPRALGALAGEGGGALLQKLSEDFKDPGDQAKLADLMTRSALAGGEPGRPALMRDVVVDGLGGEPGRLLELHRAFGCDTADGAADLDKVITGFDGEDEKAGKRMAMLMGAFQSRDTGLGHADLAAKLKDPFLDRIETLNVAGRAPAIGGPAGNAGLREVARGRNRPPKEAIAGQLVQAIPADRAAEFLIAGLADPSVQAAMADAAGQAAGLGAVVALLRRSADAVAPPDTEPLEDTIPATKAAAEAAAAMDARLSGAPPAEIVALVALADAARAAAVQEPVPDARNAALDAALAAATAAQTAMARAAAQAMAESPAGATAQAAQQGVERLPAGLPESVRGAARDIAELALRSAAITAACSGGANDSAAVAAAARAAQKAEHGDAVPSAVTDAADAAADTAAARAGELALQLAKAPRPVDPALLAQADSVVAQTTVAARGTADAGKAKAAFEAAGRLLAALDDALADAVLRLEAQRVRASPDGNAALRQIAAADAASARADAVLAPGSEAAVLSGAGADITAAAETATALAAYRLDPDLDQKARVLAEAEAKAKHGDAPTPTQIDAAANALKLAAADAAREAEEAMSALAAATPSADPAGYAALIKTAAVRGKAALDAARKVVDDGARADVLDRALACLDAVEAAGKRPAFDVMRAAEAAKTDLDVAGPAARNAAITAAEADALSKTDQASLETAARDIASRKDPVDPEGQIGRANKAATDATAGAEAARSALAAMSVAPDTKAYADAIKLLSERAEALLPAAAEAVDGGIRDAAIGKAGECAKAAAAATNALARHHQAAATRAAFDKQNADLRDTGGPRDAYGEARNAIALDASAGAINAKANQIESLANGKRTDPNQAGLSSTARSKTLDAATKQKRRDMSDDTAALTAPEEAAALTAAQDAAETLRDDLAQTLAQLGAIDFKRQVTEGARLLDLARKQADQLYAAAMRVEDEPSRTNCLQQAEAAGPAIRAAIAAIAADTATVRGEMAARQADAVAALDRGRVAMADAAAEELRGALEDDPDLRDLTEAAEERQALADLPGAPKLARLKALVARRDALRKASDKLMATFCGLAPPFPTDPTTIGALTGMVGGLPPVPAPTDPMPAKAQEPFQKALTTGKACVMAFNGALAAAQEVRIRGMKLLAELDAIKTRTTAEQDDRDGIDSLLIGADIVREAIEEGQIALFKAIDLVAERSYEWTAWANAHHGGDAATADLQAVAGFAGSEADHARFTPVSEADMIRVGPSLVLDPYTGDPLPATDVNGDPAVVDMKHITERHVRSTYEFDNHSCPKASEHDLGALLRGQLAGREVSAEEKALIQESQRAKPNSFFPEEVTAANAAALAKSAMEQAQANVSPPDTVGKLLTDQIKPFGTLKKWAAAFHQDDTISLTIPPVIGATIGISLNADPLDRTTSPHSRKPPPQELKARMFYPNEGDKLSTPDVLVLSKALGVSR